MTLRRMAVAIVVTMVAASVGRAGTVYDAYPGDNLNVMDEVLTYGDTLVIHEGDYFVDDTDEALPGGRIWRSNLQGDDPGTPEVEWITITGALGEARPRLIYYGTGKNMIDITGTTDHVRVQHLEIIGGSMAIRFYGTVDHIAVEDVHCHDNPDGGINLSGVWRGDDVVIRANYLHHIGSECMYIGSNGGQGVSNALFEHNVMHNISSSGPAHGDGIELKYPCHSCIVQDNVIGGTVLPGVLTYGTGRREWASANIIRRNAIFRSLDAGIQSQSEAIIENNVIFDCPNRGIAIHYNAANPSPETSYLRIVNNTVFVSDAYMDWGQVGLQVTDLVGSPIIVANNAFWAPSLDHSQAIDISGDVPVDAVFAANYYHGNVIGIEGLAGFIEGQVADQEFANIDLTPGAVDLYPKPGSSFIDAGDNAWAPADDYNKLTERPQNGTADVGAYEVVGAANPGWQIDRPAFRWDMLLPKSQANVVRLRFQAPITLPPGPALSVVRTAGGDDLGGQFTYSVEPDGQTLKAVEDGAVLANQTWYLIRPTASFGVEDFTVHVCTLAGDANLSARVTTADYSVVKAHLGERTDAIYDLNGSARVTTADYSVVKAHNGSRIPATP